MQVAVDVKKIIAGEKKDEKGGKGRKNRKARKENHSEIHL